MFGRLERSLAQTREYGVLEGAVRTEQPTDLPIIVVVYTGADGAEQLIDEFVVAGPGTYFFTVRAGTYRIAAFEDVNRGFTCAAGADPATERTYESKRS